MLNFQDGFSINFEVFSSFIESVSSSFIPELLPRINVAEYYLKLQKNSTTTCCYDSDKLVGIVTGYTNDNLRHESYIALVAVLKDYRGQRIASSLIDRFIEIARDKGMKYITIHTNSLSAKRLYERIGFVVVNESFIVELNVMRYKLKFSLL